MGLIFFYIRLNKYKISKFGHLTTYNEKLGGLYIQTCNPTLNMDLFISSHNDMFDPSLLNLKIERCHQQK
jgi:hypothetical protein